MTAAAGGLGFSLGLKRIKRNRDSAKRKRCSRPKASPCPSRTRSETGSTCNAPRRIAESLERRVQRYDARGKPARAAEWKQKLAAFQQANKVSDNKSKSP